MDYNIIDKNDLNYIKVPRLEKLGVKNMFTLNKIDFKLRPLIPQVDLIMSAKLS